MMDDPARAAGGQLGEYAYDPRGLEGVRDRSFSEVVKDIIGNVQEMIRSEVRLAKAELREEAGETLSAAKLLGIGIGAGLFALCFILTSAALLLALIMPAWLATLIMGVVLGGAAAILVSKGRARLKVPQPRKTIENVKENVQWMKDQTRS
jgi:uncharacterized membrane protein YqjE